MTVEYLSERLDKDTQGYVRPTRLFTHNADVDAINQKHLEELTGDVHEYLMSWRGSWSESLKRLMQRRKDPANPTNESMIRILCCRSEIFNLGPLNGYAGSRNRVLSFLIARRLEARMSMNMTASLHWFEVWIRVF